MRYLGLIFLLISLFTPPAHADYVLAPSITYYSKTEYEAGVTTERKVSEFSIKAGYLFDMGLYVGLLYNNSDEEFASSSADYSLGVSAGYFRWDFYVIAHAILDGQKDIGTGGIKYGEATGYQLDLGYLMKVTDNFSLGPQIGWRNLSYGRRDVQSNSAGTDRKDEYWLPYMTLFFHF